MQVLAQYVLRSRIRAVIVALVFSVVPFLSWVGSAILGLVTLRKGPAEGLIVMAGVALPLIAGGLFGKTTVLLYAYNILYSSLIIWVLALVLRRYSSWRVVLQACVLLGGLFVIGMHLYNPDIVVWWENTLRQYLSLVSDPAMKAKLSSPEVGLILNTIARLATGLQVVFICLTGIMSLVVARWWQAMLFNPGGLRKELLQIRIGFPELLLAGVVILAVFAKIQVSFDLLPIIAMPFILAGVSLVHCVIVLTQPKPWIGILAFYGLLLFFFKYTAAILVLLAMIDCWVNLRIWFLNRLTQRKQ